MSPAPQARTWNVAERLRANALRWPDRKAIVYPAGEDEGGATRWAHKTYAEIDGESDAYARGFAAMGIGPGTKTILMVKPSPELFAVVFALFKVGAVPVVVDPGMGIERMLHCYRAVGADAFVGIPLAHAVRVAFPAAFRGLKALVTVGKRWGWGGRSLDELGAAHRGDGALPAAHAAKDDLLIINFTTGSTGPARGVEYTHETADAMLRCLSSTFGTVSSSRGTAQEDVSLATLPLFAIFDLLLGATSVLPPMDPTKPALVDPAKMIEAIETWRATRMFASPAFLRRVGQYARENGVVLPTMRTVVAGGAPVASSVVACFKDALLPPARIFTAYGATEALPIASIESAESLGDAALGNQRGYGTCVGQPSDDIEARIIRITDAPIAAWSDDLRLDRLDRLDVTARRRAVGEIVIRGPMVSKRYHGSPESNALHKIPAPDGDWHRTGDLGWMDDDGRLWFCGRKTQRVVTEHGPLFTVKVEGIFNAHPDVYRTALVGIGQRGAQRPVICVELRGEVTAERKRAIASELRQMAIEHRMTRGIEDFLFHPGFPVDIRHNAKIGREELSAWAAHVLGVETCDVRPSALMLVPIAGWIFILYGLLAWPMAHPLLRAAWAVDVFLSVVVHALQLFVALPRGRRLGSPTWRVALFTMIFGATYWRGLAPPSSTPPLVETTPLR